MTESEAAMNIEIMLYLTGTTDATATQTDNSWLKAVGVIVFVLVCLAVWSNSDSEKKKAEEKRKQYLAEMKRVEDKAAEFEKSEFIGALAERVRASEKEHTVIGITVEKSRLCLTFGDHTKQFVSYGRLGYGTLRENSLVPVACQLLLELGSGYRIVTKEDALTPALRPNDIKLKDPNPQPQKPK